MEKDQPLQGSVQVDAETTASPEGSRSIHDIRQDEEMQIIEQEQCDRSFDLAKIKYHRFDNVKTIIFTNLESSTSPMKMHITYKTNSGNDGILMPFNIYLEHGFLSQC